MAGWFYITADIDPYPKVHIPHTYPEKGHHLHSFHHLSSIPYAAHNLYNKFHDKDLDSHQPRTDVRETMKNFYLEVELPGIKEHTELRLRWTNSRTLLLSSRVLRPEIPEEELLEEPNVPVTVPPATETAAPNGEPTTTTAAAETASETPPAAEEQESVPKPPPTTPQKAKLLPPHLTIHERLIGEMLRGFTFPVDVDRDTTHAKLDAGILRIVVPKIVHESPAARAEGEEKHFLHIPVRVFSHGHTEEKKEKPEDPVPANRGGYVEAMGDRLF